MSTPSIPRFAVCENVACDNYGIAYLIERGHTCTPHQLPDGEVAIDEVELLQFEIATKQKRLAELGASPWVSVKEALPEYQRLVALVNVDRFWATGADLNHNIYDVGFLNYPWPEKYWSVRGERGFSLDAYTHWMLVPAPPIAKAEP